MDLLENKMVLQMINGNGEFSSEAESFVKELKNYTVVSIIGPQSSGKSYLLNNLFGAKFDVLNATAGRKQTTKGIWIATCINPGMVIMDVEGFDGRERGEDDTLFERQSALFSLTVSDVLLLNMWFHDIGRQQGANLALIKLIFEERVKIEATKTTIIIVVRDHDYEETSADITRKDLETSINELWHKVHPAKTNRKMRDYIEVIVKDFPHKSQKKEFTQKSKDLSKFLSSFAKSESLEQTQYGSGFAVSSAKIWDLIRKNEKIVAADHKLAKSEYVCKRIIKQLLGSLDEEKGRYKSLISDQSISVRKLTAEIMLVHKDILNRYEEDTRLLISSVRMKRKAKLEKKLQDRFEQTFSARIKSLMEKVFSLAKSNVGDKITNLETLDSSTVIEVIRPYLKEYDDDVPTTEELPYNHLPKQFKEYREKFVKDLTSLAEAAANKERTKRAVKLACLIGAKIVIGTAWATATCDPSVLASVFM